MRGEHTHEEAYVTEKLHFQGEGIQRQPDPEPSAAEKVRHHLDEWLGVLDVIADHSEGILFLLVLLGGGGNIAAWRAARKK